LFIHSILEYTTTIINVSTTKHFNIHIIYVLQITPIILTRKDKEHYSIMS